MAFNKSHFFLPSALIKHTCMKKIFTLLLMLCTVGSFAQVRISQVYGGGGNTSATYNQDFVELFNAGTSPVDISGWSVQYASATGPSAPGNWAFATIPASSTIAAGKYYLVALATGSTGIALPTPDFTFTGINLGGAAGKVALVNNAVALNGTTACSGATVVDVIGFGNTATCFETAFFASAGITNAQSMFRKSNGCTDDNNNSTDFEILNVSPRNSASAANNCSGAPVATLTATPNITGLTATLGNPSTEGTFNLSGTNLTGFPGDISVTGSANIQVSLTSGGTFGSSVNVPYTSATLAATPIYVRIAATAPAGAVNGTVTLAGGGDADGASVTVSGSVTVGEPTVQATNVTFSNIANNSFDVNWTNGNGTGRLVVVKQTGASPVVVPPSDGVEYTVGSNVGSGNRVVYSGTGSGPVSVTGLLGGTSYDIYVYEFNGSGGSNNYLVSSATGNPGTTTTTGISPNLTQINFTSVATPQYAGGGISNTRLPVMFYATVSGLSPNTTYRYINQVQLSSNFGGTALGAGNPILIDHTVSPMTFIYSTSPSITTANSYGLFETDASGSFTGAFGFVTSGNATYFATGVQPFPTIAIAEDVASPVIQYRFALNQSITMINTGATDGTFIKGLSAASAGNVVGLWSTIDGNIVAQRPLAMTIVEDITTTGATWGANFVPGYDETAGAWNTIIPNANANGVRLIQQFDLATGNVIGCNSDADGTWPSGAVTVSPAGGATPIQITATDAPINGGSCFSILPVRIANFSVQKQLNSSRISWTTEQEINSREFVIERSNDQRNWAAIATVAAAGTSLTRINYSFIDATPLKGINFYRLRMVDLDNRAENSATKSVMFGNADVVLITPNPAATFATVYMGKSDNSLTEIIVTDMNGRQVERVRTADQTHRLETAKYSKGVYVIKVISGTNISTSKLVVQ